MNSVIKRRINILAGIVFVALLTGTVFMLKEGVTKPSSHPQETKLTLGLALQPTSSLAIIAKEKGFFEASGLQVEAKAYPSGKRALEEGLATGTVDIAVSSDVPVMMECLNNPGIRIIAAIGSTDNVNRIVARSDRNIATPYDLKGKRIATQKASAVHYFLHLFHLEYGIREGDVNVMFMKTEELVPALDKGEVDAVSIREPYVTEAQQRLGKNAVIFTAPGIYPQSDLAVTTAAFAASHPEAIEKFIQALVRAETFAREHRDEAAAIIAGRLGADNARIGKFWDTFRLEVSLEQSLILLLENQARWALRESLVKQERMPDFTGFLYPEGLEGVKPRAVSIIR